jgi:hypothetical protein
MEGKSTTELVALLTVERPNGVGAEKSRASMKIRRKSKKKKRITHPSKLRVKRRRGRGGWSTEYTENARRVDQVLV